MGRRQVSSASRSEWDELEDENASEPVKTIPSARSDAFSTPRKPLPLTKAERKQAQREEKEEAKRIKRNRKTGMYREPVGEVANSVSNTLLVLFIFIIVFRALTIPHACSPGLISYPNALYLEGSRL